VPTGFKLSALAIWTHRALLLWVVGKIFSGALLFQARLVACLGGKAKVRVRNIRIELFFATDLEIGFALIVAVGAAGLAFKILLR
jgi:hypothetical protein